MSLRRRGTSQMLLNEASTESKTRNTAHSSVTAPNPASTPEWKLSAALPAKSITISSSARESGKSL